MQVNTLNAEDISAIQTIISSVLVDFNQKTSILVDGDNTMDIDYIDISNYTIIYKRIFNRFFEKYHLKRNLKQSFDLVVSLICKQFSQVFWWDGSSKNKKGVPKMSKKMSVDDQAKLLAEIDREFNGFLRQNKELKVEENILRWIDCCKAIFCNVADPKKAIIYLSRFIQNLRFSASEDYELKISEDGILTNHFQDLLVLISENVGETGKSFFARNLKIVLEKNGNKTEGTLFSSKWTSQKTYCKTMVVFNDLQVLDKDIDTLNNLIDLEETKGENKFLNAFEFVPFATLLATSNKPITKKNTRRYKYIHYITQKYDVIKDKVTIALQKYFEKYYGKANDYNSNGKFVFEMYLHDYQKLIEDWLLYAPIVKPNQKNIFDIDWVKSVDKIGLSSKFASGFDLIEDNLEDVPDERLRISEFVKFANGIKNKEEAITTLTQFFAELKRNNLLKSKCVERIERQRFNFSKIIENYYIDEGIVDNDPTDALSKISQQWDEIYDYFSNKNDPKNDLKNDLKNDSINSLNKTPSKIVSEAVYEPVERGSYIDDRFTSQASLEAFMEQNNLMPVTNLFSQPHPLPINQKDQFMMISSLIDFSLGRKANNLKPVYFLYESDTLDLPKQLENIKNKEFLTSITYSGNKSYHVLVKIPQSMVNRCLDKMFYKRLWMLVATKIFFDTSVLDSSCAMVNKMTRLPFAKRDGQEQTNIYYCDKHKEVIITNEEISRIEDEINQELTRLLKINPPKLDGDYDKQLNHLRNSQNKYPSAIKRLVLDVLEGSVVPSGSDLFGGLVLLKSNYPLLLEDYLIKAKSQHPSNLPKTIEEYLGQ